MLLCQAALPNVCSNYRSHCLSRCCRSFATHQVTSSSRRAVVCHADGRPMWARGTPQPSNPSSSGSLAASVVNREITSCDSVPELETVFSEHSGSFDYIHASAALVKYAKLRGSSMSSPFFSKLATVWLKRLPDSGSHGYANVLWACSKLGSSKHPVWAETWRAFLDLVRKDLGGDQPPSVLPQQLSNVLYACAKLRQQPQTDELLLLLEAFVHPAVLGAAAPQAIANVVWSLGTLSKLPGMEAQGSQELLQQLLTPQLLEKLPAEGISQNVANVLVGLGRMCTGSTPLLSTAAAQGYAGQLLSGVRLNKLSSWQPQDITNIMWALSELQLRDEGFVRAAVAASPVWLPRSTPFDLTQAATACAELQYRDEQFMELLLQQGQQLLQPNRRSRGKPLSESSKASLAGQFCVSVVLLNMTGLADTARRIVADRNFPRQTHEHPSNMRRLWVFHSWLLEHQLLDGKGLVELVSEQQLQLGVKEAAVWGDKTRL